MTSARTNTRRENPPRFPCLRPGCGRSVATKILLCRTCVRRMGPIWQRRLWAARTPGQEETGIVSREFERILIAATVERFGSSSR